MALKGLDIFKLTPKKNCKECGSPTCMAFAMKVASGAVPIEKCPYMSADA
ncbi:MAG: acetyl-CoA synthase subunit gamma, partial [Clostridia bacterium]|nr:acetyl-CoA synthase subunit gamma [Clostridia bacterium]